MKYESQIFNQIRELIEAVNQSRIFFIYLVLR